MKNPNEDLVRVEVETPLTWAVWIGEVLVCSYYEKKLAERLADKIRAVLQREFSERARIVSRESKFREVKHY